MNRDAFFIQGNTLGLCGFKAVMRLWWMAILLLLGTAQAMAAADITIKAYESGSSLKVEISGSITKAGWGAPWKGSDMISGGYTEMYYSNGHNFGWSASGTIERWFYDPNIQSDSDFNFGSVLSHPGPANGSTSGSPSNFFDVFFNHFGGFALGVPTEGTTSVNATMTFPNTSFDDAGYPAEGFDKTIRATNGDELIRFWIYVPPVAPTVTTSAASNVGATSVRMNGSVTSLGIPAELSEYGFVYNTTGAPTTADTKIDKGTKTSTGGFIHNVSGLTKDTTYYYRAYAINNGGTAYGATQNFTTPDVEDQTITFNALAAKTYGDANFNLSATATSGLGVSFASSDTSVATISGSTVTIVGAGSTTITASQAGNDNYNPAPNVQQTLTVNKKALTVTASADSMTYDGSSYSGGNGVSYNGFASGDDSGDLGGSLSYAGDSQGASDAGTYTITPQGYTSDDYTISYSGGTLTINKKALTVTADADTKTYGETKSNGTGHTGFTSSGLENGETIGSVSVAYGASGAATADVGTYSDHITVSAATGGTFDANNYTISYVANDLTVNKRDLTISAFTAEDKVYDASTTATADTSTWTTNAVNGDVPVFSYTGTFDTKENGDGKTVTFSGVALTGAAVNGNYTLQTTGGSASANISKRPLTITLTDKSKTYASIDPDFEATYDSNANGGMGFAGSEDATTLGDVVIYRQTGEDVGIYPIRKFIFNETNHNYTITEDSGTFTINKKTLTISNSGVDNKVYDGTTAAGNATGTLVGTKTGDDVTLNLADVVFVDANVGSGINVTATQTLTGADAGNYDLTTLNPFTTADITAKALTISADDNNKTYGTALSDGAGYTDFTATGLVNGETVGSVSVAYSDGEAADAAATVYIDAIAVSSATGGTFTEANYSITYETGDLTVQPKALTITADQVNKTYGDSLSDGDSYTDFTPAGLENGETIGSVSVVYGSGKADNDPAGTNADSVVISNAVGGTFDITNYAVTYVPGDLVVDPKQLTVTGASASNKTYDGNTDAVVSGATLTGVLTFNEVQDDVTIQDHESGTFDQATVGNGINVTTAMTLSGAKASNYSLQQPTLSADITAKELSVTGATVQSRAYDGTTDATITGATLSGAAQGDDVTLASADTGVFAQATIGVGINVTTAMELAGNDKDNYSLVQPTLAGDITARPLTVINASVQDKTYDGTTDATVSGAQLSGVLNADLAEVTLGDADTGTFASADIGNGITVTTAMTISGAKAANYTLSQPSLSANITSKAITITADAKNKEYGDSDPELTYQITSGSLASGDSMSGSLSRDAGEAVGSYTITQGTLTPGGNYDVTYTSADLTVTKRTLTMTADDKSKTYGQTDPDFTVTWDGFVNGDDASSLGGSYTLFREVGESLGTYSITVINMLTSDNYTINAVDGTFTIEGNPVTVTVDSGQTKEYGDADPVFTYTYTTMPDVTVSFTGALSREAGDAAGSYAITQGTLDAGANNTITFVSEDFTITKKTLSVTNASVTAKEYDGNTDATVTGATLSGVLNGDDVSLASATSGTFADKNVGNAKSVTTSMTLTGADAGNYDLTQPTLTGDITTKALGVSGLTVANKVYDRTTDATVSDDGSLTGTAGGDDVSIASTSGVFASADVGSGIDVTVSYTLTGNDKDNYTLANQTTTADITAKPVTVTGTFTVSDRTYDGTTVVTIDQNNLSLDGVVNPDTVTLTAVASVADKAAAADKSVTLTGSSLGGAQAANYSLDLSGAPTSQVTIAGKALTINGSFDAADKTYDGTTDATYQAASGSQLDAQCDSHTNGANVADGVWQSFTAASTGELDKIVVVQNGASDANITVKVYSGEGTGGALLDTATLVSTGSTGDQTIDFSGVNVTQGQQYTFEFATINSGSMAVLANLNTDNCAGGTATQTWPTYGDIFKDIKYYTYVGTGSGLSITGVVGGDDVSLTNHDVSFADKQVGTGKTVTLDSVDLAGDDADNYTLSYNSGDLTTTADISARVLTLSSFTADNKVYDATTDVTGDGFDDDRINGDELTFSYDVAFASKAAGSARTVEYTNIAISGGADQGNYTLAATTGNTTAEISKAALTVNGATAVSKTYDGTTAATVTGASLSGVIGSDDVTLANATSGTFAQSTTGAAISVTTAMTLSGNDAGNYTLSQPSGLSASINGKALTISGLTAAGKAYDGTTSATLSGGSLVGVAGGDDVSITAGTGVFASADVGTHAVTASGYAITGDDAGNYSLSAQPTVANATISAKSVTISGVSAADKSYDGTTEATLSGGSLSGIVSGDTVTITAGTGAFASAEVGTHAVTASGYAIGGADAGNYSLSGQPTISNATISKASLIVSADSKTKEYGASDPSLTYSLASGTLFGSDAFSGALSRESGEDVGSYAIGQASLTAGDNYNIVFLGSTLTITKMAQTVTFAELTPKTTSDAAFDLTASASSGLTVTFSSSDTSVATVSGNTVTIVGAGSTTITASQAGNDTYQAASQDRTLGVIDVLSGGGTEQDPYKINTKDQLNGIRNNPNGFFQWIGGYAMTDGDNIEITNDGVVIHQQDGGIDLSEDNWVPIGTEQVPFTGGLIGVDGSPLVITGQKSPLFGYVGAGAKLADITLEPGTISSSGSAGALAASIQGTSQAGVTLNDIIISGGSISSDTGGNGAVAGTMNYVDLADITISDVSVSSVDAGAGTVAATASDVSLIGVAVTGSTIEGASQVGGIFGSATDSYLADAAATVTVLGSGDRVGGLMGYMDNSTVAESVAVGIVTGQGSRVGGLAGYAVNSSTIDQSYSTAHVWGTSKTGGITGELDQSTVSDSYVEGTVEASETTAGGLVGLLGSATVTNALAKGAVTAPAEAGGLVGAVSGANTVTASYWDTDTSGQSESAAGTGKTSAQLRAGQSYSEGDTYVNWLGDRAIWTLSAAANRGYPYLQTATVAAVSATADPDQATIDGDGNYPVGTRARLTITANSGYELASVSGCNGQLDNTVYETGRLSADCAVTVNLREIYSDESPFADLPESSSIKTGEGFQMNLTTDFDADDFAVTLNGQAVTDVISCVAGVCKLSAPSAGEYVIVITDPADDSTHTVTLTVQAQVDIGLDEVAAPGETVAVPVYLDEAATAYPVVLSYQVAGTLATSSHTAATGVVVIESGLVGWISYDLAADATENATVIITLSNAENASLGIKTTQTTTVQVTNLSPEPAYAMSQDIDSTNTPTFRAIQGKGDITITVSANDPNPADTHTYDWSGTATELLSLNNPGDSNQMTFSPATLTAGYYRITTKVTDNNGLYRTISRLIEIREACDTESAGCGVKDESGQGVADRTTDQQNSLPVGSGDTRELETLPGLTIGQGEVAFAADKDGAYIDEDSIEAAIETPPAGTMISSYNFEVTGLPTSDPTQGHSIPVVLPLKDGATIPVNPRWYKYHPNNAEGSRWVLFVEDSNNALHSAPSSGDNCPGVNSDVWESGLVVGYDCVRITIEDGGPNDADDEVNGAVEDPSMLLGDEDDNGGGSSGGSGTTGILLLWSLLMLAVYRRRYRA